MTHSDLHMLFGIIRSPVKMHQIKSRRDDDLIAQQKQCGQEQDNGYHAYQSASCHQHAHRADDVDIRIDRDSDGRGEQSHAADDYRRDRSDK